MNENFENVWQKEIFTNARIGLFGRSHEGKYISKCKPDLEILFYVVSLLTIFEQIKHMSLELTILTRKTVFYSIQYKNLLKYKLGCFWLFSYVTQSINFSTFYCHTIKEYRCLTNVIYQIERYEWLLLSAFQHGLRQSLGWFWS